MFYVQNTPSFIELNLFFSNMLDKKKVPLDS